jgi:hypothetical protein
MGLAFNAACELGGDLELSPLAPNNFEPEQGLLPI